MVSIQHTQIQPLAQSSVSDHYLPSPPIIQVPNNALSSVPIRSPSLLNSPNLGSLSGSTSVTGGSGNCGSVSGNGGGPIRRRITDKSTLSLAGGEFLFLIVFFI